LGVQQEFSSLQLAAAVVVAASLAEVLLHA
jgi:hypothetical protein